MKARYHGDPLTNLTAPIPARFFYLQGLAAFLAELPENHAEYEKAIRAGEAFLAEAFNIAPKIARRDVLMASTFMYLVRKEELLCQ